MYIIHLTESEHQRLKKLLKDTEELDHLINNQEHVTPLHVERGQVRAQVTAEIQSLIAHSVSEAQVLDACKTALDDLQTWHNETYWGRCTGCTTCSESNPMLEDVIHTLTKTK